MEKMSSADTKSLLELDRGNLWHHVMPYSKDADPMIADHAEGAWITDRSGKKYLDGVSGLWCVNVGYGREALAGAAYEQLKKLAYYPLTQSHEPAILLAAKLNEWLGGGYKIFFSNSGSDANEVAFKIARQYHEQNGEGGRYKFISRYRAYHGASLGALSATGQSQRKYKYEPLTGGFLHVAPPDSYRRPEGQSVEAFNLQCALEIEKTIIWEGKETIAGVIMEPLITGGGIIVPHPVYLKKVADICRKHGVLLIIDEVVCGFGRTGKNFGFQHDGIQPDIVTMAKGITSGYLPLSATAVRQEIFDKFQGTGAYDHFRHVNTFGGHPASCAVALKNLEIMEEEQLVERARVMGAKLLASLSELKEHPKVGDVRGKGLIMGIELVEDKRSKAPAPLSLLKKIVGYCADNGVIIGKNGDTVAGFNNILILAPPLSATEEDFALLANTLKKAIFHCA